MSRKITLESLKITKDEFKELESKYNRADLSKKLKVSKDTLTRFCNELDITTSRVFKEWSPKLTYEEIMNARNLANGEDYESLLITSSEFRKHIKYYNIPNKTSKVFKDEVNNRAKNFKFFNITPLEFSEMVNIYGREYTKRSLDIKECTFIILSKQAGIFKPRKYTLETYFDITSEEFIKIYNIMSYSEIFEKYNISEDIVRKFAKQLNIVGSKHKTQDTISNYILQYTNNVENNNRKLLNGKEIDIIFNNKFGIEYDGILPHSIGSYSGIKHYDMDIKISVNAKKQKYKTMYLKEHHPEFQLFTINEIDWQNGRLRDIWKSIINTKLQLNEKIYARKCIIKEVGIITAKSFLKGNHMQGYSNSSHKYGLYFDNELIMMVTFGKSRFNENKWELIRICSKQGVSVIGGASKLLKHFERINNPLELISYADMRWSKGEIYNTLGFRYVSTSQDYYYYKKSQIFSRYKFMKKNMKNLEDFIFDETKTEWENMNNNGYRMLHGVGQMKFIKYYK